MRKTLLGGMLVGMLASGCASVHNKELDGPVRIKPGFPEPTTKTQEIAAYLREHGQDGGRCAKCAALRTDTGSLTICYVDLNRSFDYRDDIFYFSFEEANHTCIDLGLNDTLDDVVLEGTVTPISVKETKPEFQAFLYHEYNVVVRKVYREMKREGLL